MHGCAPKVTNRPCTFHNTKWICNKPDIWFEVDKNSQCTGEIKINGVVKPIIVHFGQAYDVHFFLYNKGTIKEDGPLFTGEGTFSKDKMLVEITEDNSFNDKYKTITFYRKNK